MVNKVIDEDKVCIILLKLNVRKLITTNAFLNDCMYNDLLSKEFKRTIRHLKLAIRRNVNYFSVVDDKATTTISYYVPCFTLPDYHAMVTGKHCIKPETLYDFEIIENSRCTFLNDYADTLCEKCSKSIGSYISNGTGLYGTNDFLDEFDYKIIDILSDQKPNMPPYLSAYHYLKYDGHLIMY